MKLDERKFLILQAIIDDYITTAVPVGSRTISRKAGVGFSPATIRNEMSDLEELGYLDQPHTSAGRIPSYKAYRLYVDRLLKVGKLSDEDARRIQGHIDRRTGQIEEVIRNAAQVLSDMTQYTSLVMPPQSNTLRINRVQLVQVNDNTALMIVVTNAGIVKDTVIRIPEEMHADHLYSISKMLTEMLKDRPMHEVRAEFAAMFRDMQSHRRLFANVLDVLENELREDHASDMVVGAPTCSIILNTAILKRRATFLPCWNRRKSSIRCFSKRAAWNLPYASGRRTRCPSSRIARSLPPAIGWATTPAAPWASSAPRE